MRILICGGRAYANREAVEIALSPYRYRPMGGSVPGEHVIIHGGAEGADTLADEWARKWVLRREIYRPDWKKHGKAAGPLRNSRMIAEGRPDICIAFPGGRGTEDMKRKARAAGIEVIEVRA